VTMITGTMEIARDGTVISETHTGASEPRRTGTKLPELAEWGGYLLENLRARVVDSEEDKAKYEEFITSLEAYLGIPPYQRKVRGGTLSETLLLTPAKASLDLEFVEKLKELLGGDDELKKVLSEIFN